MSRSDEGTPKDSHDDTDDGEGQTPIDRRKFIRVGGLGKVRRHPTV